jgi:hypothetical protein
VGVKQHTIGRRPGIGLFAGRDQYAKVRLVGPVRRLDGLPKRTAVTVALRADRGFGRIRGALPQTAPAAGVGRRLGLARLAKVLSRCRLMNVF